MRAILLASATATTLNGRRARSCVSHGYFLGCWRARRRTACAPTTRMRRKYRSPCLEIGPSFCLPPVESCRGTSPIQAAKSRPERKTMGSDTVAAIALAPMMPMPGNALKPPARLVGAMLLHNPLIKRTEHGLCCLKLRCQHNHARPRITRQALIPIIRHDRQQLLEPCVALRSYNAELGQVPAQRIDQLGALAHQQITRAMLHQLTLLLLRLDPHEPHRRPPHGLADCRGVGGIVLVALEVCLNVLRWHQANLMPELRQFARPVMRRGTRLHANQARRQRFEKPHHFVASQLLPDNDLLLRIDAVDLEYVLGDIQTDRGNLHLDGSPHGDSSTTITLWHFDAGSGRRPPHQYQIVTGPFAATHVVAPKT